MEVVKCGEGYKLFKMRQSFLERQSKTDRVAFFSFFLRDNIKFHAREKNSVL